MFFRSPCLMRRAMRLVPKNQSEPRGLEVADLAREVEIQGRAHGGDLAPNLGATIAPHHRGEDELGQFHGACCRGGGGAGPSSEKSSEKSGLQCGVGEVKRAFLLETDLSETHSSMGLEHALAVLAGRARQIKCGRAREARARWSPLPARGAGWRRLGAADAAASLRWGRVGAAGPPNALTMLKLPSSARAISTDMRLNTALPFWDIGQSKSDVDQIHPVSIVISGSSAAGIFASNLSSQLVPEEAMMVLPSLMAMRFLLSPFEPSP